MTERTRFIAYITKYALTQGIQNFDVEDRFDISPDMVRHGSDASAYFHKGEWWRSYDEARHRAEAMRKAKIASLRKQIARLEGLTF